MDYENGNYNDDGIKEGGDNEESDEDDDFDIYDYVSHYEDWDDDEEFDQPTENNYEHNRCCR